MQSPDPLKLMSAIMLLTTAIFVGMFIQYAVPSIAGYFFPVTTQLSITSARSLSANVTEISGSFTKLRDCPVRSIVFCASNTSRGCDDGDIIAVNSDNSVDNLPIGPSEFGPVRVRIPKSQLVTSEIFVFHRCHPFWLTATSFYRGSKIDRGFKWAPT